MEGWISALASMMSFSRDNLGRHASLTRLVQKDELDRRGYQLITCSLQCCLHGLMRIAAPASYCQSFTRSLRSCPQPFPHTFLIGTLSLLSAFLTDRPRAHRGCQRLPSEISSLLTFNPTSAAMAKAKQSTLG